MRQGGRCLRGRMFPQWPLTFTPCSPLWTPNLRLPSIHTKIVCSAHSLTKALPVFQTRYTYPNPYLHKTSSPSAESIRSFNNRKFWLQQFTYVGNTSCTSPAEFSKFTWNLGFLARIRLPARGCAVILEVHSGFRTQLCSECSSGKLPIL